MGKKQITLSQIKGVNLKIAGGIFFLFVFIFTLWINSSPSTSHDGTISISQGVSGRQVVRQLVKEGYVRSSFWLRFLIRIKGASRQIKTGVYRVKAGQSASKILKNIVTGRTLTMRVTVPEGFASWQIASRLDKNKVCSAQNFQVYVSSHGLEGFLFPETYHFDQDTPVSQVSDVMVNRFWTIWKIVYEEAVHMGRVTGVVLSTPSALTDKIRLHNGQTRSIQQIVTMASLIEREAQVGGERSIISSVYYNRLKKKMRLEADPTVQYSLGYWKDRILYRDLKIDNPYNTYRYFGLPPGPICSPGKESLLAALTPEKTDYLYFVADLETGSHWFSSTYKEHLKAVRRRDKERRKLKLMNHKG